MLYWFYSLLLFFVVFIRLRIKYDYYAQLHFSSSVLNTFIIKCINFNFNRCRRTFVPALYAKNIPKTELGALFSFLSKLFPLLYRTFVQTKININSLQRNFLYGVSKNSFNFYLPTIAELPMSKRVPRSPFEKFVDEQKRYDVGLQ